METSLQIAKDMMIKAHEGQKRWDGRPYWVHPVKVVEILQRFGIQDPHLLCAGYLHDTLEDTKLQEDVIFVGFGAEVINLVKELTFKEGSDNDYFEQCHRLSEKAKLIKIADILANITDEGHKSDHFIRKRVKALSIMLDSRLQVRFI